MEKDLSQLAITTLRMLAVDAVEKANSGHPGMPMGAADYAFLLWTRYLRYSIDDPTWTNRDRFILSAGHGCMLLYALLHLSGHKISLEEIKNFRQWGSLAPGHPEFGLTPGVDATTGPLGQGFANGVGMAIASKMMARRFNQPDFSPVDHHVYAIVSDGDLMEGVASEAASMAGHLKLSNLIYIYDDNQISIDGHTSVTFTEDVAKRFEAYGWHTERIDGHQHDQILRSLERAHQQPKPSLILARTHIAYGAPKKQDTAGAHGAPLGAEEVKALKEKLGWPLAPTFHVPSEVRALFEKRTAQTERLRQGWMAGLTTWKTKHPDLAKQWDDYWTKEVPEHLYNDLCQTLVKMPNATRVISSELEQKVAIAVPQLVGGSADLESSTKTGIKNSSHITAEDFSGRNICYGVREHAMGAITNGLSLYGSFIPLCSTFLQFADYMRPAIRIAALSHLQSLFIFTHDSIFVGEDGPTHQPVEHIGSLRLIPNLFVVRPADPFECAAAWQIGLSRKKGPTAYCLSRQNLPTIDRDSEFSPSEILKGGYVVQGRALTQPDLLLVATGSELHLAIGAKVELHKKGISARVISIPCLELFADQPKEYRENILPSGVPTTLIEAARGDTWYRWIGKNGLVIGVDQFGHSAPSEVVGEKFGFTVPAVTQKILGWLK